MNIRWVFKNYHCFGGSGAIHMDERFSYISAQALRTSRLSAYAWRIAHPNTDTGGNLSRVQSYYLVTEGYIKKNAVNSCHCILPATAKGSARISLGPILQMQGWRHALCSSCLMLMHHHFCPKYHSDLFKHRTIRTNLLNAKIGTDILLATFHYCHSLTKTLT